VILPCKYSKYCHIRLVLSQRVGLNMISPRDALLEAITACFSETAFTDLVVKSGGMSWKVHRVIVCSQSPVLKAACSGSFQEAFTGVINLEDDDPATVFLMLCFLYTADYEVDPEHEPSATLSIHAQMFTLADKYDLPALMSLAKQKYESLQAKISLHDCLPSISEVYTLPSSGNSLRNSAVCYAREQLKQGLGEEKVRAAIWQVVNEAPDYGFDLLESFVNIPLKGNCRDCGPNQGAIALQARCTSCNRGCIYDLH